MDRFPERGTSQDEVKLRVCEGVHAVLLLPEQSETALISARSGIVEIDAEVR